MSHSKMQLILFYRFKNRNKIFNHRRMRYSTIPVLCTKCAMPILIGDRVISKNRKRGNVSIFHKKCLEGSYIDIL